jgi:signal transduction histidine kinase
VGIGLVRGDRVSFPHVWRDGAWHEAGVEFAPGADVAAALGEPPGALLTLPIEDRQGVKVGVLAVRRPEDRAPFTKHEEQLIDSLTHQAAVAIENADLLGDLKESETRLAEALATTQELLRNEQQVTRMLQELNEMKSSFMIVTAHEMRTPLTILKGYHEALRQGVLGLLTREQEQSLAICEKTTDRLIASFNDILAMLEIDGGRMRIHARPVDLRGVLKEVVGQMQPFLEQRSLDMAVEAADAVATVPVDAEKMQIALVNLVENAIKFTPDGGRIRLRVLEEGAALHVAVEDSGIGIERDELERIFDKFYTSRDPLHHTSGTYQFRARGSGLGLAIAKGYVEAHGGRILAESEGAGKGSAFHVVLPRPAALERASA